MEKDASDNSSVLKWRDNFVLKMEKISLYFTFKNENVVCVLHHSSSRSNTIGLNSLLVFCASRLIPGCLTHVVSDAMNAC